MRRSRCFFPVSILAAVALLLGGCAKNDPTTATSSAAAPAKLKLGYLVKQPEEPWFQFQWKAADKAAAQYDFELLKFGTQDGEKVMAAIDNLAVAGAQGFVICTPDVRLGPQIIARAAQKGLKVIAVDDQFVLPDGKFMPDVHYIGMSASQIGQSVGHALAAEMKHRNWPADETGVCVVTFEELDTARQRTDGAIAALKDEGFPADHIFKTAQKTTDVAGSFDAASVLFTREPAIKHWLACALNDTGVLGAIRATEARGFTADNVIGIGINGTDCIDELRKPRPTGFFGSMLVSAPGEGFRATEMLYQWVKNGTNPPLDTRTPGIFINRDNFEAVLKKEGIIP